MLKEIGCYILDNDEGAISKLKSYIDHTPGLVLKGSATNPYAMLRELQDPETLLFMETNLGNIPGIDIARKVNNRVVFITAHPEYALESFDNENTIDYLLKPVTYDRFLKAVKKACCFATSASQVRGNDILQLKIDRRIVEIDMYSIDYLQAAGNYSYVFFSNKKILAPMNLGNMEPLFPPGAFLRVHKSYIVNTNKIKSKRKETLTLFGGATVKVGRTYRMNLK